MFEGKNHLHALASAIGTLGGFAKSPAWFQTIASNSLFQIVLISIWIYQSGGKLDFPYSLMVAILFYSVIESSRYIAFGVITKKEEKEEDNMYYDEEPFTK